MFRLIITAILREVDNPKTHFLVKRFVVGYIGDTLQINIVTISTFDIKYLPKLC
jgi:hypothetical protein